ncbi:fumarylacetoacetate hydrolase family protein [Candidatus Nanopelagicales bacterium]|nr:fumarylacetoacetate hydrolase family protein [Candidatus Nanopelagicales bacterium]
MLICRFAAGEDIWYGAVDGLDDNDDITEESIVAPIEGHPFVEIRPEGSVLKLADVRLLAPVLPSKVVCVGKNYRDHAAEMGGEAPEEPLLFLKPSTSVIGSGDPIDLPWQSEQVEHEGELAVVIGRMCKDVPVDRVNDVIFGYTIANDVTARDLQKSDGQWTRAKGFDTFCPIGPWIQTELNPADADITVTVNGEQRQHSGIDAMVHDVPALVAYVSSCMTLLPGDVILTGTPAGVGPLVAGDSVSVGITGIGTLTNPVRSAAP